MSIVFSKGTSKNEGFQTINMPSMPKRRDQKVVILMAPPGIAPFAELEQTLYYWNHESQLKPWSWAIPDLRPEVYHAEDGFRPLIESIHFHSTSPPRGHEEFDRASKNQSDFFLEQFSQTFLFEWMKNKNILISSDQFALWEDNVKSVRKLLNLLPWHDRRYSLYGSDKDVKVVVLHPMDRLEYINHVFQLSSSTSQPSASLSDWLTKLNDLSSFDILGLAQIFHDLGMEVQILPFANHDSHSLKSLVACNILGLSICQNGSIRDDGNDAMKGKHHLNTAQLDDGTFLSLLVEYECSFEFVTFCSSELTPSETKANLLEYIKMM